MALVSKRFYRHVSETTRWWFELGLRERLFVAWERGHQDVMGHLLFKTSAMIWDEHFRRLEDQGHDDPARPVFDLLKIKAASIRRPQHHPFAEMDDAVGLSLLVHPDFYPW